MKNLPTASPPETAARRRLVVERVEAFIRAHLSDPLPVTQLCRLTGVSERTLRNAFQEVRGVSPKRYMLRARLNEVHRTLKRAPHTTVTAVATNFGFFELGRFASHYRSAFGVVPSSTLHTHNERRAAAS